MYLRSAPNKCTIQRMFRTVGRKTAPSVRALITYFEREDGCACRIAGRYVLQLMKKGVKPSDIMTRQAFENAMVSVIATGKSSPSWITSS